MGNAVSEKKLSELVAGDKIVLRAGRLDRAYVKEVKRTTNTQIIIEGAMGGTERKFRKDNGRELGVASGYYNPKIYVATSEELKKVETQERNHCLMDFEFRIPNERADLINEVYEFLKSKDLL